MDCGAGRSIHHQPVVPVAQVGVSGFGELIGQQKVSYFKSVTACILVRHYQRPTDFILNM